MSQLPRILVVDDDEIILTSLQHSLSTQGYDVVTARNGYDALGIAKNQCLDLIISDIMLPDLSGLNLLSMLKRFYLFKIPIIIISSLAQKDAAMPSIGLGADDFFSKPIDYSRLSERVKSCLK